MGLLVFVLGMSLSVVCLAGVVDVVTQILKERRDLQAGIEAERFHLIDDEDFYRYYRRPASGNIRTAKGAHRRVS